MVEIYNKHGNSGSPITFRAQDPEDKPTFTVGATNGSIDGYGGAIDIWKSSHIVIEDTESVNSLRGINVASSIPTGSTVAYDLDGDEVATTTAQDHEAELDTLLYEDGFYTIGQTITTPEGEVQQSSTP